MPFWMEIERNGQCFMHSCGAHQEYTPENSYCHDYINRKMGNKDGTLDDWIEKH